ncbi:MAG: arylsulfatase [Kiritimatiellales bacterium]
MKTVETRRWLSLAASGAMVSSFAGTQKPNVVFILSDDQGYGDFECYGNPYLKTPHLNRLHDESIRIPAFYTAPVCAPTRASLMTSRYNYRTSVWDTWQGGLNMRDDELTVAEVLKENGYKTALFGKWHLGYNCPFRPEDQGFDEVLLWDMFHRAEKNRHNPVMIYNGELVGEAGYEEDVVFNYAIDFLQKNKISGQPFFMVVASTLPHTWVDYQVPEEYVERFAPYREISRFNAEILAMVEKLDENVGRLLETLDSTGLTENTIVIFTSDNGPEFDPQQRRYNVGLRGRKGTTYEGGIKVPCFIRWPGVLPAGKDIQQVGTILDFMPTVLDMCGIPFNAEHPADGISLWPYISGEKTEPVSRSFCGQFYRPAVPAMWENCYVRSGDYKLVNGTELFNIAADPFELNDLAESLPQKKAELRQQYEHWFADVTKNTVQDGEFVIHPIIVGDGRQRLVNLRYSDKSPKHGWPMTVASPGPYKVTVNLMQNELFDDTSVFCIQFGDQVHKKKILPNSGALVFDNVMIAPGEYEMQTFVEGTFISRIFRTNPDIGHRNIHIEPMH